MTKINKDNPLDRANMLESIIPGEICSNTFLQPPKTSIYLTQISKSDLEEFHNYSIDEKLYDFFEFEPFKTMSDTEAYFQKMQKRMNVEKSHYFWFVRSKDTNNLIGLASLANINFQRNSVEWGQGINPEYWGQNYNLEIHELLKHFVFDVLKFNRLYGQTMVTNERAIAGIKASGCSFEGIQRQLYKKGANYIDAWNYSMLADEYFQQANLTSQASLNVKLEDIIELVSYELKSEQISHETSIFNCRLWDSMSQLNIIIAVATKYNVQVQPLDYAQLTSVELIYDFLKGK